MSELRHQDQYRQQDHVVHPLVRLQHDWEKSIRNVRKEPSNIGSGESSTAVAHDPLIFLAGGRGRGGQKDIDPSEKRRLQDEEEKNKVNFDTFWMQYDAAQDGTRSRHVELRVSTDSVEATKPEDRELFHVEKCEVTRQHGCVLALAVKDERGATKEHHVFRSAAATWRHIHSSAQRRSVECIDVSEGGTIGISGSTDGQLRVWEARDGTLRRSLEGHLGDIYVAKILPSAEVAMSSGADMQIKIWRLADGMCAVTLRGHTGAVKAISFVDRGRNFISCGKDGTVRLWDCASQSCITSLARLDGVSFNDCSVEENVAVLHEKRGRVDEHTAMDQRDFGTEGKLAIAVSNSGSLYAMDVRTRETVCDVVVNAGQPLNSCFLTTSGLALVGTQHGSIVTYDLRNTSKPLQTWKHSGTPAAILCMSGLSTSKLCFSTGDGLCALYDYQKNELDTVLTGSDYDPVYGIAASFSAGSIFTACRDGAVRKYIA